MLLPVQRLQVYSRGAFCQPSRRKEMSANKGEKAGDMNALVVAD